MLIYESADIGKPHLTALKHLLRNACEQGVLDIGGKPRTRLAKDPVTYEPLAKFVENEQQARADPMITTFVQVSTAEEYFETGKKFFRLQKYKEA